MHKENRSLTFLYDLARRGYPVLPLKIRKLEMLVRPNFSKAKHLEGAELRDHSLTQYIERALGQENVIEHLLLFEERTQQDQNLGEQPVSDSGSNLFGFAFEHKAAFFVARLNGRVVFSTSITSQGLGNSITCAIFNLNSDANRDEVYPILFSAMLDNAANEISPYEPEVFVDVVLADRKQDLLDLTAKISSNHFDEEAGREQLRSMRKEIASELSQLPEADEIRRLEAYMDHLKERIAVKKRSLEEAKGLPSLEEKLESLSVRQGKLVIRQSDMIKHALKHSSALGRPVMHQWIDENARVSFNR